MILSCFFHISLPALYLSLSSSNSLSFPTSLCSYSFASTPSPYLSPSLSLFVPVLALQQMEAKDQELVMLKDRLATSSKDGEQTRTEIGTARIENARLSAEKETLVDKVKERTELSLASYRTSRQVVTCIGGFGIPPFPQFPKKKNYFLGNSYFL